MIRIDIEKYIDELKGFATEGKEMDLYSLKRELVSLNQSSKVFENFEKESMVIEKKLLKELKRFKNSSIKH